MSSLIVRIRLSLHKLKAVMRRQQPKPCCFRAYAYNMLVTLWGDVPLVTESTSIPRTDYTRNAVAEVDGVIDSDLVYAMSNLPVVGAAKMKAV